MIIEEIERTLDNAERLNPQLNSFLSIERDHATRRIEEVSNQTRPRPLLGTAIAIKDNICTKGMRTSCGSRILQSYNAHYDATAVSRLNEAGAIVVGKTNMDEFAMYS